MRSKLFILFAVCMVFPVMAFSKSKNTAVNKQSDSKQINQQPVEKEKTLNEQAWDQYTQSMKEDADKRKEAWDNTDKLQEKEQQLVDRYEKLIQKWEELTQRYEKVLEKWEKQENNETRQ